MLRTRTSSLWLPIITVLCKCPMSRRRNASFAKSFRIGEFEGVERADRSELQNIGGTRDLLHASEICFTVGRNIPPTRYLVLAVTPLWTATPPDPWPSLACPGAIPVVSRQAARNRGRNPCTPGSDHEAIEPQGIAQKIDGSVRLFDDSEERFGIGRPRSRNPWRCRRGPSTRA